MSFALLITVVSWIVIIFLGLFFVVEVVIRIIRRFISFPMPAFAATVIDNPIRRRIQPPAKVVDWIGIKEGVHLEIGPGPGTFTIEAANRANKGLIFAVDIQVSVIRTLIHNLCKARIENVVPTAASVYELPFFDNTFDRVLMMSVLAEIPDKEKALHEVRRVLKDDGLLAIGEFLPDPDYPRQKTVINWCDNAGFNLVKAYGGFLHYVLTFKKRVFSTH